jgi:hypothetical protein
LTGTLYETRHPFGLTTHFFIIITVAMTLTASVTMADEWSISAPCEDKLALQGGRGDA